MNLNVTERLISSEVRGAGFNLQEVIPPELESVAHLGRRTRGAGLRQLERERVCCLLVLNLVSSTLSCIRQPRPRLRVLDVCGVV